MQIDLDLNGIKYHIMVEPSCYTPFKHGVNKDGKEKEICLGYPSTLSRSIQMIIKEELSSSPDKVNLLEYIERYEKCISDLKKQVDF